VTPEQWTRIAPIVDSALTRDEHLRSAFVADACGDDAELRRQVDSLLAQASRAEDVLKPVAQEPGEAPDEIRLVGCRIGPYAIDGRLGAGGMGEVYHGRDTTLHRDVAIKILPPAFTGDAERVARFEREARMLAALNHPGIGAIYGVEDADGVPALILELVDGPTLAERLMGEPLGVADAVAIAIAITEALQAAHDRGIIHRDIKPANIKITPAGAVKLLDFGLARDATCPGATKSMPPGLRTKYWRSQSCSFWACRPMADGSSPAGKSPVATIQSRRTSRSRHPASRRYASAPQPVKWAGRPMRSPSSSG
jgi:serine/threonine protein kinase